MDLDKICALNRSERSEQLTLEKGYRYKNNRETITALSIVVS